MKKFYQQGLHFECTACGECCRIPEGNVFISYDEAEMMARYLEMDIYSFIENYCLLGGHELRLKENAEQTCIFLEGDRCAVYRARPIQCRTFPFWPENLKSSHRWTSLRSFCPGIDSGGWYSSLEIRAILHLQKDHDRPARKTSATENKISAHSSHTTASS